MGSRHYRGKAREDEIAVMMPLWLVPGMTEERGEF